MQKDIKPAGRLDLLGVLALVITSLVLFVSAFTDIFPLMVVLGPLMLLQYAYWHRRGPERTTREYLAAEPRYGSA